MARLFRVWTYGGDKFEVIARNSFLREGCLILAEANNGTVFGFPFTNVTHYTSEPIEQESDG